jgi:hypothetical protein
MEFLKKLQVWNFNLMKRRQKAPLAGDNIRFLFVRAEKIAKWKKALKAYSEMLCGYKFTCSLCDTVCRNNVSFLV